jgi:hypothetical protein
MPTSANPYGHRVIHALGGGALGIGIGVIAALVAALLGEIHTPAEAGVILGLSLFAGLIIGWLAG